MRSLMASLSVLSLAVVASPACAQERASGRWNDVAVSLAARGDAFGAEVLCEGVRHRLTLREDAGGRWELVVERRVHVAGSVGLAGVLAGREAAPTTTWGDARVIALVRSLDRGSVRLLGAGVDLRVPERAPSATDVGWFTDADDLRTDGRERRALEHALASGDDGAVRSLGPLDVNLATPDEKARLIEHLLDGDTTDADRAWMRETFDRLGEGPDALGIRRVPDGEGARVLEALRRRGRLGHLARDGDLALFRSLPANVRNADLAAALVSALARGTSDRDRRLAAHWVLDRARAEGKLDAVLARLADDRDPDLRHVLDTATPARSGGRRAIVYGHRAEPLHAAENTGPAIESALARGATGVEIDLCFTRDGQIVLWHDESPDGAVALLRQLGLEGGSAFRPSVPALGSDLRRPIHRLTLAEVRRSHGYSPGSHVIPTLDEVAPLLAQLESVILDLKVPGDQPALVAAFGRRLRGILDRHGLASRSILMSPDARVVRALKPLIPAAAATHDVEITRVLAGGDHSAVRAALALHNTVASVGRPVVPKLGGQFSYYLQVLRRDRARIEKEALDVRLVAWTIDDELELREVLAVGVDGVLTNEVDLALEVMRKLGL